VCICRFCRGVAYALLRMGLSDFAGVHVAAGGRHVMGKFHQDS
jgi:hypothetical protein